MVRSASWLGAPIERLDPPNGRKGIGGPGARVLARVRVGQGLHDRGQLRRFGKGAGPANGDDDRRDAIRDARRRVPGRHDVLGPGSLARGRPARHLQRRGSSRRVRDLDKEPSGGREASVPRGGEHRAHGPASPCRRQSSMIGPRSRVALLRCCIVAFGGASCGEPAPQVPEPIRPASLEDVFSRERVQGSSWRCAPWQGLLRTESPCSTAGCTGLPT